MLSLSTLFGKRPVVNTRNGAVGASLELLTPVNANVNQYSLLDRETTVSISSSSADDDGSPAGTGALTVKIDGIDRTGAAATETVTMNGQTAVTTTETYAKITAITVVTVGTGGTNAGDLYVIRAGESALTSGVPDTKAAIMGFLAASGSAGSCGFLGISSGSTDDAAAGTGARTVTIFGLDWYWKPQEETITLNGQTMVIGTKRWRRVIAATVATAGTGLTNAGVVYVYPSEAVALSSGAPAAATAILVQIPVGSGEAMNGLYTIPQILQNTYYKLKKIRLGISGAASTVHIQVRPLGGADATEVIRSEVILDSFTCGPTEIDLSHIPSIIGPADIEIRALSASTALISAQLVLERQA